MPRGFLNAAETFVMFGENGIYLNLYTEYECKTASVCVKIGGSYLSDGKVTAEFKLAKPTDVYFRIPEWSKKTIIDGELYECPQNYVKKRLDGKCKVTLEFDMIPTIRDFPREPERFASNDFRVVKYICQ